MNLVDAARALIGVPWQHQARSREAVDCLGLLVLAERATGRVVTDRTNYGREPNPAEFRAGLIEHYGEPVLGAAPALADLRPGDKLFIQLPRDNAPRHIAIVGDSPNGPTMIHAWAGGLCRVVEVRLSDAWRRHIYEVYR